MRRTYKGSCKIFLFFLSIIAINSDCTTDLNCKNCTAMLAPLGPIYIVQNYCTSCKTNFSIDAGTNICQCSKGYYPADAVTCLSCPNSCATCTDASTCNSCYIGDNRQLVSGRCSCIDGY